MLTEKLREEIKSKMSMYSTRRSTTMEALRLVQKEQGHITRDDMAEIARILGMTSVQVEEVASFYTMYNKERPVGRYHIQVCRNLSCSLLGAEHLIEYMERFLGIKVGETTGDGRFTLSTVECLGSCGTAPMMQINDDYYENLTEERIKNIIESLK